MAKAALVMGDRDAFFKAVLKNIATGSGSSEICFCWESIISRQGILKRLPCGIIMLMMNLSLS